LEDVKGEPIKPNAMIRRESENRITEKVSVTSTPPKANRMLQQGKVTEAKEKRRR